METNKCQLSIVIPVFNGSNEINICLDSIYSQGMSPEQFEVICAVSYTHLNRFWIESLV